MSHRSEKPDVELVMERPFYRFTAGRYALKWVGLALIIGAAAGLGAILFDLTINVITSLLLNGLADTQPPVPVGDEDAPARQFVDSIGHKWLVPLVTAGGGLLSGLMVHKLAPEAAGSGNDAVLSSYHYDAGQIRGRVGPVKLLASALTIGAGGSAGREGPSAQFSAAFGALVGRLFKVNASEQRVCVLVGMGAGIGAIFRAPLGGAILASELLYRDDMESDAIIPSLIASIAGYSVFSMYAGWQPLFGTQAHLVFNKPVQLIYFSAIGLLAGLVGLLYARTYTGSVAVFERLRLPFAVKTAVAGLLVGMIGIAVPETLETGYGWVQFAIDNGLLGVPVWILLLLPFLKILTTSLTVGSGTPGGVFGPGVFIGAMLGVGLWRVFHDVLPSMPPTPGTFSIIAMVALLGAAAHVPLAVLIMVAEMTRNLSLLAPAMVAVGIATMVVRSDSIVPSQLSRKADSPVHRYRYAFPLLSTITVADALQPARILLKPGDALEDAEQRLHEAGITGAPVVDQEGHLLAALSAIEIALVPEGERSQKTVGDVMESPRTRFDRYATLDTVLDSMASENLAWIPIVERTDSRELAGILSFQSVLEAYRGALTQRVRRADAMINGSTLLEVRVGEESPLCRYAVRELDLPEEALLISYTRHGQVRFPHGDTIFEPDDVVGVVTSTMAEPRIRRLLAAELDAKPVDREDVASD